MKGASIFKIILNDVKRSYTKCNQGKSFFFQFLTLNTEVTSPQIVTAVEFFLFPQAGNALNK